MIVLSAAGREQGVVENGAPILPAVGSGRVRRASNVERHAGVVRNLQMNGLALHVVAIGDARHFLQAHLAAGVTRRIGNLEIELLQIVRRDRQAAIAKAVKGSELLVS